MSFVEILLMHRNLSHDNLVRLSRQHGAIYEQTGNTYIFPAQNVKVEITGGWSIFGKNWRMSTFLPRKELNGVPFS